MIDSKVRISGILISIIDSKVRISRRLIPLLITR